MMNILEFNMISMEKVGDGKLIWWKISLINDQ